MRRKHQRLALDALLLLAVVCVGAAVYTFFGAGATWLYAGSALLALWWVIGTSARDESTEGKQ